MMQSALATDETLEGLALGLLGRYEREFGALAAPPVPVEQIVENVLDLGILWEPIDEGPDEHILADLLPESRTVVFNERRHPACTTPSWAMRPGTGRRTPTAGPRNRRRFRAWSKASAACSAGLGTDRAEAHRFMGFLLMPEALLLEAARRVDLYRWPALYQLRDLFQVTISALSIRLQQLGLLYVTDDGRLFRSRLEYMGQLRLSI